MATQPYEMLTGVGTLYIAQAGTAKPDVNTTPGASWREVGETDGGVKVTKAQKIERFTTDQRTGPVKARRTEEGLTVETNLTEATLENLADLLGLTVTDTPPGVGTIGTREIGMYGGGEVAEYALLFRGESAYGDYPAQFYIPRGYFDDDIGQEFKKDDKVLVPVKFEAMEDLNAATEAERFGIYEMQDAAAT